MFKQIVVSTEPVPSRQCYVCGLILSRTSADGSNKVTTQIAVNELDPNNNETSQCAVENQESSFEADNMENTLNQQLYSASSNVLQSGDYTIKHTKHNVNSAQTNLNSISTDNELNIINNNVDQATTETGHTPNSSINIIHTSNTVPAITNTQCARMPQHTPTVNNSIIPLLTLAQLHLTDSATSDNTVGQGTYDNTNPNTMIAKVPQQIHQVINTAAAAAAAAAAAPTRAAECLRDQQITATTMVPTSLMLTSVGCTAMIQFPSPLTTSCDVDFLTDDSGDTSLALSLEESLGFSIDEWSSSISSPADGLPSPFVPDTTISNRDRSNLRLNLTPVYSEGQTLQQSILKNTTSAAKHDHFHNSIKSCSPENNKTDTNEYASIGSNPSENVHEKFSNQNQPPTHSINTNNSVVIAGYRYPLASVRGLQPLSSSNWTYPADSEPTYGPNSSYQTAFRLAHSTQGEQCFSPPPPVMTASYTENVATNSKTHKIHSSSRFEQRNRSFETNNNNSGNKLSVSIVCDRTSSNCCNYNNILTRDNITDLQNISNISEKVKTNDTVEQTDVVPSSYKYGVGSVTNSASNKQQIIENPVIITLPTPLPTLECVKLLNSEISTQNRNDTQPVVASECSVCNLNERNILAKSREFQSHNTDIYNVNKNNKQEDIKTNVWTYHSDVSDSVANQLLNQHKQSTSRGNSTNNCHSVDSQHVLGQFQHDNTAEPSDVAASSFNHHKHVTTSHCSLQDPHVTNQDGLSRWQYSQCLDSPIEALRCFQGPRDGLTTWQRYMQRKARYIPGVLETCKFSENLSEPQPTQSVKKYSDQNFLDSDSNMKQSRPSHQVEYATRNTVHSTIPTELSFSTSNAGYVVLANDNIKNTERVYTANPRTDYDENKLNYRRGDRFNQEGECFIPNAVLARNLYDDKKDFDPDCAICAQQIHEFKSSHQYNVYMKNVDTVNTEGGTRDYNYNCGTVYNPDSCSGQRDNTFDISRAKMLRNTAPIETEINIENNKIPKQEIWQVQTPAPFKPDIYNSTGSVAITHRDNSLSNIHRSMQSNICDEINIPLRAHHQNETYLAQKTESETKRKAHYFINTNPINSTKQCIEEENNSENQYTNVNILLNTENLNNCHNRDAYNTTRSHVNLFATKLPTIIEPISGSERSSYSPFSSQTSRSQSTVSSEKSPKKVLFNLEGKRVKVYSLNEAAARRVVRSTGANGNLTYPSMQKNRLPDENNSGETSFGEDQSIHSTECINRLCDKTTNKEQRKQNKSTIQYNNEQTDSSETHDNQLNDDEITCLDSSSDILNYNMETSLHSLVASPSPSFNDIKSGLGDIQQGFDSNGARENGSRNNINYSTIADNDYGCNCNTRSENIEDLYAKIDKKKKLPSDRRPPAIAAIIPFWRGSLSETENDDIHSKNRYNSCFVPSSENETCNNLQSWNRNSGIFHNNSTDSNTECYINDKLEVHVNNNMKNDIQDYNHNCNNNIEDDYGNNNDIANFVNDENNNSASDVNTNNDKSRNYATINKDTKYDTAHNLKQRSTTDSEILNNSDETVYNKGLFYAIETVL